MCFFFFFGTSESRLYRHYPGSSSAHFYYKNESGSKRNHLRLFFKCCQWCQCKLKLWIWLGQFRTFPNMWVWIFEFSEANQFKEHIHCQWHWQCPRTLNPTLCFCCVKSFCLTPFFFLGMRTNPTVYLGSNLLYSRFSDRSPIRQYRIKLER